MRPQEEEEQKAGPDHLTRTLGSRKVGCSLLNRAFLQTRGVWLQWSQDLLWLWKLGVWVVFIRDQGPWWGGGTVLHAWQLQPLIWELLWYSWCHWGLVSVKICEDFFVISQKWMPVAGMSCGSAGCCVCSTASQESKAWEVVSLLTCRHRPRALTFLLKNVASDFHRLVLFSELQMLTAHAPQCPSC